MNRVWRFYNKSTGLFLGRQFSGPNDHDLAANAPEGCAAYEGSVDHLSQRIDVETKELVDWVPPQPSQDHEWNANTRRWVLVAEAAEQKQRRAAAQARIEQLEAKQPRAVREAALGLEGARERLAAIDAEIASLRTNL